MELNIEQLRLKKSIKKTTNFNLLLLGAKGIGKKTFFTNLCNDKNVLEQEQFTCNDYLKHPYKFTNDNKHFFEELSFPIFGKHNHSIINLNAFILNTGDKLDNSQTGEIIKDYIESKFDKLLMDENKIQRFKCKYEEKDNRIHLCIYFIDGNQGKLNDIDFDILNKITGCTNIMFVIGKADKFARSDWAKLQNKIKSQIYSHNLCSFKFGKTTLQDIFINNEEQKNKNIFPYLIDDSQPFPIICGNVKERNTNNEDLICWKRKYCNKEVYIEDYQTSFFIFVKAIILGSHLQDFKDITADVIYERYRTEKLLQRAQTELNDIEMSVNTNGCNIPLKQECNKLRSRNNNDDILNSYTIKEKNRIIEAYEKKFQYMENIIKQNEAFTE